MGVIMDSINSNNRRTGDSGRTSMDQDSTETSGKLQSWKSRFSTGRNRSTSDLGNYGRQPNSTESGITTNKSSLASQRNKTKKNWKGSFKNLLVNQKKEGNNGDPSPHSQEAQDINIGNRFEWQDAEEESRAREIMIRKQETKEKDGFCRRVDFYDGQVLTVDGKESYEIGNYLGGGVAGVVYEGIRLLPSEEYPVRQGVAAEEIVPFHTIIHSPPPKSSSFLCGDVSILGREESCGDMTRESTLTDNSVVFMDRSEPKSPQLTKMAMDVAVETTISKSHNSVFVDRLDAPSRSKYSAQAAASASQWFMEETVAIKILNPVSFRILSSESMQNAVVVHQGEAMPRDVLKGRAPMQMKHVWWLVNPSSRNLQTLQRYNLKKQEGALKKSRDVDRGTQDRGLRLSLVAAFMDSTGLLRELPLTRCIEIWGHIPFSTTDSEFEEMIESIERVNAGHEPSPLPSRVPTLDSDSSFATLNTDLADSIVLTTAKTGLYRAAASSRTTVFCDSLNAFIALPAVPPKYLRWLRQRRAATKEIRNMMLIGRHRNVVHLYEVLEYIQDNKSTMFLVLELVRGGELFDLISNNSDGGKKGVDADAERKMRKFFFELASGIHYCHANGIAHRDLKPENLLVHHGTDSSNCTLKIADFGLSATFGLNDDETIRDSVATLNITSTVPPQKGDTSIITLPTIESVPAKQIPSHNQDQSFSQNFSSLGQQAMQYLTCGNIEDVNWCLPSPIPDLDQRAIPSPLKRMTSVVGSPHYVAPEIIFQNDKKEGKKKKNVVGYDGTKADVWSAGVILYAMLYRSLPFGEDLTRCPRFQSYRKWYESARKLGGRRSSIAATLNPEITEADESDMLGPHWFFPSETSTESRDLIIAMLNPIPEERLSIEFVLQHPWLTQERSSISTSKM